ncbi:MAG: bifunctional folylpolyglutamate synthase/dihydrofolate synthase [Gemmatimonadetes bacterium]|nr:bifunctional folylpolyglutamate synthase/dihydrofolate synthase [Gemmatimonadota bacterium]
MPRLGGGAKWSLEPTRRMLADLGDPQERFVTVHIGGTNGKGSVATMVYAALQASGYRTGLYTSPHLVDVRERMVVDGIPIGEDAFAVWTTRLRPIIEASGASFFEATTAIALADFAARGVEVAVIEVGLGGRLDSTNVVCPAVSAVTNVGMDHTEFLGDTLAEIALEKAGIAKAGVPFVLGDPDPATADMLRCAAVGAGAPVMEVPAEAIYAGPLRLQGRHQRKNAAVAVAILEALRPKLPTSGDAVAAGLARAWLPGRFDHRGRWLFDVAHNVAGVAALAEALVSHPPGGPVHGVLGFLRDKDAVAMTRELATVLERIWVTCPSSAPAHRRMDLESFAAEIRPLARIEPDLDRCLSEAADGAGTVLVAGSFHTVGDVMARLPGFRPFG